MTSGLKARAGGHCFLLFVLTALGVPMFGDVAAAQTLGPLPQVEGPPPNIPWGSTWVPTRQQLEANLAPPSDGSAPQTLVSPCFLQTGTPTVAPASTSAAVSATNGVAMTNAGYRIFDKSTSATSCPVALSPLTDVFGNTWDTISGPHIIYDTFKGVFVAAALVTSGVHTYVAYNSSINGSGSLWETPHAVSASASSATHVVVGYNKDHWIVTHDHTVLGVEGTFLMVIAKTAPFTSFFNADLPSGAGWVPPVIRDNATEAQFLRVDGTSGNLIQRDVFNLDTLVGTTSTIAVNSFTPPPPVAQPNGQKVNPGDGRFLGPSTQIGTSVWNVQPIGVDGHARFRLYKFSTSGSTPLLTFTPTIYGDEDLFDATMATASDAAGASAFVMATAYAPTHVGNQLLTLFNGPNDSPAGWSYDGGPLTATYFATTDGATACNTAGSCAWAPSTSVVIDPSDTSSAWGFTEYVNGTKQTEWGAVGIKVNGAGTIEPPLAPIASDATDVGQNGFTANWSGQPPATSYELDVALDAAFASIVSGFAARNVGNVTEFAVTGLSPATDYYFRVRAVASATSLSSNTVMTTTSATQAKTAIEPLELLALALLAIGGLGLRRRFA